MSRRFQALLIQELRLQYRYGIYIAYTFVVVIYACVLILGSAHLSSALVAFIIYSDPSVLGFFFLGALMMLEKAEGVRFALSATPISAAEYFWAKALPLTLLGLIAVTLIAHLIHDHVRWFILLGGVFLTALAYLGIGVPIALHFRTVTGYLIGSSGFLLPIVLPSFLAFLDPMPVWAMLLPTAAQFRLIMVGVGAHSNSSGALVLMFLICAMTASLTIYLGIRKLEREFGRK
ncbi:MAG: hypothetical protein AAFR90_14380 [Pseudomonadota bacterium]